MRTKMTPLWPKNYALIYSPHQVFTPVVVSGNEKTKLARKKGLWLDHIWARGSIVANMNNLAKYQYFGTGQFYLI